MFNIRFMIKINRNKKFSLPQFLRFCVLRKYTKEHEWIYLENDIVI